MEWVERIIAQGHGPLNPSYCVIHETANPGATALDHVSYWSREPMYAVHYVTDWTDKCYHTVLNDRLCYQVGNGNAYVIGIEICHANNQSDFDKAWQNGVDWAVGCLKAYNWGLDRLISHDDARRMWGGTDHTDPIGYFAKFGRTWADFVGAVAAQMGETNQSAPIQLYTPNLTDAQRWGVEHHEDGTVSLRSISSGLYLDMVGCGTTSGTPVHVYAGNNSPAQRWVVVEKSGTYNPSYTRPKAISPAINTDLRLDAIGAGTQDGTGIWAYEFNDSPAQQWQIIDYGDGTWTIINIGSNKALDVVGGGK